MSRKSSTLLAGAVSSAAGKTTLQDQPMTARRRAPQGEASPNRQGTGGVMIGAIFAPSCRKVLKQIEVDTGKKLRQLLGEAINDLAVKYGQPQPYREDG